MFPTSNLRRMELFQCKFAKYFFTRHKKSVWSLISGEDCFSAKFDLDTFRSDFEEVHYCVDGNIKGLLKSKKKSVNKIIRAQISYFMYSVNYSLPTRLNLLYMAGIFSPLSLSDMSNLNLFGSNS
jgi:hypothetical protein